MNICIATLLYRYLCSNVVLSVSEVPSCGCEIPLTRLLFFLTETTMLVCACKALGGDPGFLLCGNYHFPGCQHPMHAACGVYDEFFIRTAHRIRIREHRGLLRQVYYALDLYKFYIRKSEHAQMH